MTTASTASKPRVDAELEAAAQALLALLDNHYDQRREGAADALALAPHAGRLA